MNSLSWLLYIAGVSGSFGVLLIWMGIFLVFGGGVLYVLSVILRQDGLKPVEFRYGATEDSQSYKNGVANKKEMLGWAKSTSFWGRSMIIIGVVGWFIAAGLPSKETVYAIAASEMGEELLKTPTAAKATKALDAWLDKQIAEQTKKAASQ